MRALSMWQPYASLIAGRHKSIETRGWHTSYRGLLAIHAASRKPSELRRRGFISDEVWLAARRDLGVFDLDELPRQKILCICEVRSCERTEGFTPDLEEWCYGDYSPGRFAWVLGIPKVLNPPFPQPGQQGLWTLDPARVTSLAAWPAA